ncbi:hypothetical protein DF19_24005 [Streptomyces olindensis]|nr:hypothetical protein DF19_24005 [Streptomyces olindensis]
MERAQECDLARTPRWIADEERRRAERRRGLLARPSAPDWLIERGLSGQEAVYVHVGGCWNAGQRSGRVDREHARRALADGVKACPQCRPDTAFGFMDG